MGNRTILLASGLVAIAAVGVAAGVSQRNDPVAPPVVEVAQADTIAPVPQRQVPQSQTQMQLSFAPVVKQVTPSVVNVYATTITQARPSPFANDPFFQHFFGGDLFGQGRPRESRSLGSGVIVDKSGIILTNSHVVHGATDVRIATSDGREYAVDVVLDDAKTDLAVLKIKDTGGHTFAALPFADSDKLQVGDLVLAIGNPFGVGQTVTSGIVSALGRTGIESSDYEAFIQTDAAINPGNSGGALVDSSGTLVGINTAIYSESGGSLGIGFAIPAKTAHTIMEQIIATGTVTRGWLGIEPQDITPDLAKAFNLGRESGVIVAGVLRNGPAWNSGMRVGDIVVKLNGQPVEDTLGFLNQIAPLKPGGNVEVDVLRAGKPLHLQAKVGVRPRVAHPGGPRR